MVGVLLTVNVSPGHDVRHLIVGDVEVDAAKDVGQMQR